MMLLIHSGNVQLREEEGLCCNKRQTFRILPGECCGNLRLGHSRCRCHTGIDDDRCILVQSVYCRNIGSFTAGPRQGNTYGSAPAHAVKHISDRMSAEPQMMDNLRLPSTCVYESPVDVTHTVLDGNCT